jgi:toxin ParE1/3/4
MTWFGANRLLATWKHCSTTYRITFPAGKLRDRLVKSTNKLAEFPRLYEVAPLYGEGVRRISQSGYHVLYKIDDQTRVVNVLAVVGQRQLARKIH